MFDLRISLGWESERDRDTVRWPNWISKMVDFHPISFFHKILEIYICAHTHSRQPKEFVENGFRQRKSSKRVAIFRCDQRSHKFNMHKLKARTCVCFKWKWTAIAFDCLSTNEMKCRSETRNRTPNFGIVFILLITSIKRNNMRPLDY